MECRSSTRRETQKEKIAMIILELREDYSLTILLKISKMSRSTYYYIIEKSNKDFKNDEIMNLIISIYYEHKECYGYRRITLELINRGYAINHKKVKRLMSIMGLYSRIRKKRKYSSFKETKITPEPDLIKRDFVAMTPNEKWYTDVTEFNLRGEKIYLSPIIDGFNGEVISYNLSKSPNLNQTMSMLESALSDQKNISNLIIHSDQGWQYQHHSYKQWLRNKDIKQSMSRKGNCLDNAMMESFFGILKCEMFYGMEKSFKNIPELELAIRNYISYYNFKRIRLKLKGLSPVEYRNQVLQLNH